MKTSTLALSAVVAGVLLTFPPARVRGQAPPAPDEMVAALKKNLADSQTRLRQYEWIETTAISLKGDEKSRKQQRVYYGADGKLTKLPIDQAAAPAQQQGGRGGRGRGRVAERVIENKKDDMQEYMEKAAALIQKYVPPNPAQIQAAKDAGKMQIKPQAPGVRIEFPGFVQADDLMTIDVDAKAMLLSALNVKTYLEKPEDAVTLAVQFAALTDGTSYTKETTLDATAKEIRVVVSNSGHRPLSR